MPEEIRPDEVYSSQAEAVLEAGAEAYQRDQEQAAKRAFDSSIITVVFQLMPEDNHLQGRLGLLSVRNDADPPLFAAPLRSEELELAELLALPSIARLINELKALLP